MAKGATRQPYTLHFTDEELQEKPYRKYRYPQEINGIVFEDDIEKKLSESTWFRCLPPGQQVIVEKQMRLRAKGEFDKKILHYEDKLNEAALGIAKPTMKRLVESVSKTDFAFFMSLLPYIHVDDGLLRNKQRKPLDVESISEITQCSKRYIHRKLEHLDAKRMIFAVEAERAEAENRDDIYLSFVDRIPPTILTAIEYQRPFAIYVNPFIVFFGQYIDKYVVPYFVNSGWYVINPYADRIAAWIEHNCIQRRL